MFSDDEIQSAQGSVPNGHRQTVSVFTNGTSKVQEDSDDDMPLVCARNS